MSNYTNLKNYEKAERLFFQLGKFTLKNVVLMNNASGNNNNNEKNKLDVIYKKDYPSTKYNNMDQLSQLKIRTSDFLVFAYNDFSVKPFINEEIYTSYNHLNDVMSFFLDINEKIIQQEQFIYNDEGTTLTELGNTLTVTSQEFVQGKMMSAIPVINVDASNNILHQIAIFFDNENYYEIFSFKNIFAIIDTLEQVNLPTISGQTLIISMLDAIERQTRYANSGSRYNNNNNNNNYNYEENGQVQDTRFLNRNIPSSNNNRGNGSSLQRRSLNNSTSNSNNRPRPSINNRPNPQNNQTQQNNRTQEQEQVPVQNNPQPEVQNNPNTKTDSKRRIGISDIKKTAQTIDVSDLSNVEEIDV